mmetsp:Transcript_1093/g.2550  ORF Transcript_1093/g.2550 Transcript_1093/m.2550 type:complete len:375 (-) Transcript_1093:366-1490(-)
MYHGGCCSCWCCGGGVCWTPTPAQGFRSALPRHPVPITRYSYSQDGREPRSQLPKLVVGKDLVQPHRQLPPLALPREVEVEIVVAHGILEGNLVRKRVFANSQQLVLDIRLDPPPPVVVARGVFVALARDVPRDVARPRHLACPYAPVFPRQACGESLQLHHGDGLQLLGREGEEGYDVVQERLLAAAEEPALCLLLDHLFGLLSAHRRRKLGRPKVRDGDHDAQRRDHGVPDVHHARRRRRVGEGVGALGLKHVDDGVQQLLWHALYLVKDEDRPRAVVELLSHLAPQLPDASLHVPRRPRHKGPHLHRHLAAQVPVGPPLPLAVERPRQHRARDNVGRVRLAHPSRPRKVHEQRPGLAFVRRDVEEVCRELL